MSDFSRQTDSNKRVAFVYNSAWYLVHFRAPLVRALQERGYETHAITPADGSEADYPKLGMPYHRLDLKQHGLSPAAELRAFLSLYRILRNLNPDLVVSYTIKCNIYCGIIRKLMRYRHIVNIVGLGRAFEQSGLLARVARFLYRFSIRTADAVFFQNREDRDSFVEQGILLEENTIITPGSGVDLEKFAVTHSPPGNKETFVFFMYGRLIPAKGFDALLHALQSVNGSAGKKIECWIAGALDGTQAASLALRTRLESAAKSGLISYLGHRNDIRQLLDRCDVVVLPSTYNEGVPRSLLEALACGKPIITTNWKGCRETLDGTRNGRMVEPHSHDSLAAALKELIELSSDQLQEMGRASRELAERKFDQRIVLKQYLDVIERLQ